VVKIGAIVNISENISNGVKRGNGPRTCELLEQAAKRFGK